MKGFCFAFNALSFGGTLYALWVMKVPDRPAPRAEQGRRAHLAEGIAWAWRARHVRAILALVAVSSLLALPYTILLPAVASEVLHGGPGLFGLLQALAGVGAFAGAASLLGRRGLQGLARRLGIGATCLGGAVVVLGLSRSAALSGVAMVLAGAGMISQMAGTMTLLQALAGPEIRGRLIGIFSTLFIGVGPFGALAAGWIAHRIGAPATLVIGGSIAVIASAVYHLALPRLREALRDAHPEVAAAGIP